MPTTIGDTDRKKFLASLTPKQNAAFHQLEELLKNEQGDIGWHYRVGSALQRILPRKPDAKRTQHGRRFKELTDALRVTSAPLHKKQRFATEFGPAQVQQLRDWEDEIPSHFASTPVREFEGIVRVKVFAGADYTLDGLKQFLVEAVTLVTLPAKGNGPVDDSLVS